jgi:hypothetical protein
MPCQEPCHAALLQRLGVNNPASWIVTPASTSTPEGRAQSTSRRRHWRCAAHPIQLTLWHERTWFVEPDGRLQLERLLEAFAELWREHAEAVLVHQPYHEAAPQLVLLAFLQRVVNGGGGGYIDREYAVGLGRMDLLLRWPLPGGEVQREALELKVWREKQSDPLERGLAQLERDLERLGLDEGTLVIFDRREQAPPIAERTTLERLEHGGRRVRLLRA